MIDRYEGAAAELKPLLSQAKRIAVTTHLSPDGDAIGSLIAVGLALLQLHIEPVLVCDDAVESTFDFLPLADQVVRKIRGNTRFDAIIVVDCGDADRYGRALKPLGKKLPPIINIDHHISNTAFGAINIVDPEASATAEILANLFPLLDIEISSDMAAALLTGLVTDTQVFRIPAVTPATLQVASQLTGAGANLADITMRTMVIKPLSTVQMWRLGLNNMRITGPIAWTTLARAEKELVGDPDAAHDGLNNILADIAEVMVGIVLNEREDGRIKVGLRSRPPVDVSQVAVALGGGGHRQAAGALIDGPLEEAAKRVVDLTLELIDSLPITHS